MSLESKKQLVKKIAYDLHMEFWIIDHGAIMADVEEQTKLKPTTKGPSATFAARVKQDLVSWHTKCEKEKTTDTTVVAIASNGDILVAANIKRRTEQGIRKGGKSGGNSSAPDPAYFGFYDRRHDAAIQRVTGKLLETREVNIINLIPAVRPRTPQENAALHAEMQILRYAKQEELRIEVMGISKPACAKCAAVLDEEQIPRAEHIWDGDKSGISELEPSTSRGTGKKVLNWADPSWKYGFGNIMRRTRIQHVFEVLKPGGKGEQVVEWQVGKETPDFWVRRVHRQ